MNKVILRTITVKDVDDLMMIVQNPDVSRYIPNMIQDRDSFISWIRTLPPTDHEYMIVEAQSRQVIGECSIDDTGEIGLMLLPEYWRQGYGTDTVIQLIDTARSIGLEQVMAQTDMNNKACVGLLRSLGFTPSSMGWVIPDGDWDKSLNQYQSMVGYSKKI